MKHSQFVATLNIRIDPDVRAELDRLALLQDESLGEVTRRLINKGLRC